MLRDQFFLTQQILLTPKILTTDHQDMDVAIVMQESSFRSARKNIPRKPHSHTNWHTNEHVHNMQFFQDFDIEGLNVLKLLFDISQWKPKHW